MLDICNSVMQSTAAMKHPNPNCEPFEFNLGKARELRCVNGLRTVCGNCESCKLTEKINRTKQWFLKSGLQSQRRFMLGLIRRFHSTDLMQYVVTLLSPLLCKDFTYSRMRTNPALDTDRPTMSSDRALNCDDLEAEMAEIWLWFQHSKYWTKANFVLALLQHCEAHLLHIIATQARTLLSSERRAQVKNDGDYEAESISTSEYSYITAEHPELNLLTTTKSNYSTLTKSPFVVTDINGFHDDEIVVEDSEDDLENESELSSLDPTCMVIPTSVKAYSGVARYKDFIRCLPVHISKCILGYLDMVSLRNCVFVSNNWRILVEEVQQEYFINQQLWEEVMLLQGAAAQGCNPIYAKDIDVKVPNLVPDSWDIIRTGENEVKTTLFSESSLETAYSGCSTRNVIMEEKNIYCGAYNVMVLSDTSDPQRVVHTEGGKLVAIGSQDRKVRLIHAETMREVEPVITGHAGSVRCVHLCEKNGYVLSGSYDTSIRCWSLETGKCQKILRGHRDTVTCVTQLGDTVMSGGKDRMCKVWNLNTKKCLRTFKHRHPISAIALGEDRCISGCEGGRVKVWDLKTAQLIKRLSGHSDAVTGIKFDKWHIITCSRDQYALVWSGQGNHDRCLNALRHPKEVLCLEFMYLRVITGSADGKVRIWNLISGQCLRIMRGNSRSDPVLSLIAIDNRVTINTTNNLLVLNFEPVEYDYTLEDDKMPPLVQYGKYSDAPVRSQPYPYVRAQRMKTAGATNVKILKKKQDKDNEYDFYKRTEQLPHSAKSLSRKSLHSAKVIQSFSYPDSSFGGGGDLGYGDHIGNQRPEVTTPLTHKAPSSAKVATVFAKPPTVPSRPNTRSKAPTVKSQGQTSFTSVAQFKVGAPDDDSEALCNESGDLKRRISWAFEHPLIPKTKDISLPETKSLLRSQMRVKGEVVPPDFIYLTINAVQQSMRPGGASKNTELSHKDSISSKHRGRPSSSPARIDPRTKVPLSEMDLEFDVESKAESVINSESESKISKLSKFRPAKTTVAAPATTTIVTGFSSSPVNTSPHISMYSKRVPSSIPRARVLKPRPHTAAVVRSSSSPNLANQPVRSHSAHAVIRPMTSQTMMTARSEAASSVYNNTNKRNKTHGYITSATETSMVPMLMYSIDVTSRIQEMKEKNKQLRLQSGELLESGIGKVSPYNNPLRTHTEFRLLTHEQVEQQVQDISQKYRQQKIQQEEAEEKRSRVAWLSKVKSKTKVDYSQRPLSAAPEIREFNNIPS